MNSYKNHILKGAIVLGMALLPATTAFAQKSGKSKKGKTPPAAAPAPAKPEKASIESKIKSCKKMPGLFSLYQDTVSGKLYMLIKKEQLGKEYIHFTYSENGTVATGHNRGAYRESRIFSIEKYFENIEFRVHNTNFYFDPNSALSRSADANVTEAVLASEKMVASDEKKGEYLIDADELLLSEKLHQVKPSPFPGMPPGLAIFQLGALSKNKTRYREMRNYPANTDVVVDYVFDNPYPVNGGDNDVTDARSVTATIQHSFIAVPENDFQYRMDDARIGYFSEQVNDMTTRNAVNYSDLIHRWHLKKKDPNAAISDPVEPIVWWIEKTTPVEFRETIRQAGMQWNKAFESAGFSNAVDVRIQPDTATWDAGDIRYNVLRWTSSPNPPFGGYGPSFVNPRTGQILGADIMLEYIFVTNRYAFGKAMDVTAENAMGRWCDAGHQLHMESLFAREAMETGSVITSETEDELLRQSLHYLVLHEMGHTMGLNHNMKASQLLSPAELEDTAITNKKGLIGSVMDYPAINVSHSGTKTVQYCQTEPGPYDHWAIEFGYREYKSASDEAKGRAELLARSGEPQLAFGNDADDMRSPGNGIDPRVMINDLSSDAIAYSEARIGLVKKCLKTLRTRYEKPGQSYQEMVQAYNLLMGQWANTGAVVSRYIGGVYVNRVFPGSNTSVQPFRPVDYAVQKRAMNFLYTNFFRPQALPMPEGLAEYLQPQRRGFGFFGINEDPKMHNRALAAQASVLSQLLNSTMLRRMTDSRMYGNKYSTSEMMTDLVKACFADDLQGNVSTMRQNLQVMLVNQLLGIAGVKAMPGYDAMAKSAAYSALKSIKSQMQSAAGGDAETRNHRTYLIYLIDEGLDN